MPKDDYTTNSSCKNAFNTMDFPGGPPAQYYPGPTGINFADRTGYGVLRVVWSNALVKDAQAI